MITENAITYEKFKDVVADIRVMYAAMGYRTRADIATTNNRRKESVALRKAIFYLIYKHYYNHSPDKRLGYRYLGRAVAFVEGRDHVYDHATIVYSIKFIKDQYDLRQKGYKAFIDQGYLEKCLITCEAALEKRLTKAYRHIKPLTKPVYTRKELLEVRLISV